MSAASDYEVLQLDLSLAADGQDIELWHLAGTQQIPVKVTCRAFVRTINSEILIGTIRQDSSKVIISPTQIIKAGWPGPWTPTPTQPIKSALDRRVPTTSDKCLIAGKLRAIDAPLPIYVDDGLVRIEMRVLG